jgi:hypothetical protein
MAQLSDNNNNNSKDSLDQLCTTLLEACVECASRLPPEIAHVMHTIAARAGTARGVR